MALCVSCVKRHVYHALQLMGALVSIPDCGGGQTMQETVKPKFNFFS